MIITWIFVWNNLQKSSYYRVKTLDCSFFCDCDAATIARYANILQSSLPDAVTAYSGKHLDRMQPNWLTNFDSPSHTHSQWCRCPHTYVWLVNVISSLAGDYIKFNYFAPAQTNRDSRKCEEWNLEAVDISAGTFPIWWWPLICFLLRRPTNSYNVHMFCWKTHKLQPSQAM